MASEQELVRLVPHYSPGFVILAYVVAVLGAWSSLELLLRRTGMTGAFNALLLLAAGIAFGSTATWGMHFIGNQSLTLSDPTSAPNLPKLRLSYSAGLTILSLFVSCIVAVLAFSFLGLRWTPIRTRFRTALGRDESPQPISKVEMGELSKDDGANSIYSKTAASLYSRDVTEDDSSSMDGEEFGLHPAKVSTGGMVKIIVAGTICGAGIAAMHYVGQFSISGLAKVDNDWWTVVLSILIAVLAVITGLWILFVLLRPRLQHSWYKRLGVAMILGGATTLMHFVALLGTHYYIVAGSFESLLSHRPTSRTLILVLVGILTPLCCISLLAFAVFAQQRIVRRNAARQRTILSVALFDNAGNILVQPEDRLLPSAQILTGAESDKFSFADVLEALGLRRRLSTTAAQRKLSRKDPAFLAFMKESWRWRMPGAPIMPIDNDPVFSAPDIQRAVAAFEQAASEIAQRLSGRPDLLQRNGVLHDDVLKTGHFPVTSPTGEQLTVTQGHLLVTSRRVTNIAERDAFLSKGYLFVEPSVIAHAIGFALAVPEDRIFTFMRDVYNSTRALSGRFAEPGRLYAGVLICQATAGDGLRLVVDDKQHWTIPMVEMATLNQLERSSIGGLPPVRLDQVLHSMSDLAGQSLAQIEAESRVFTEGLPVTDFDKANVEALLAASAPKLLEKLVSREAIPMLSKRLVVTPKLVPLLDPTDEGAGKSYMICLKVVVPASVALPGPSPNWYPFPLFKIQSECLARTQAMKRSDTLATSRSLRSSISGPSYGAHHDALGQYDAQWVTHLIRDTSVGQNAGWAWVQDAAASKNTNKTATIAS